MNKRKTINLNPFKMEYAHNGYANGLIMKREITFQEANHIARKILGISTEIILADWSDGGEALNGRRKELIKDITNLIKGNIGFDWINQEWACGDALDDLNIAIFFDMLLYLSKKGII